MTDKALTDKDRLVEMMLNCPAVIMDFDTAFCLADHLIANNVVVQKQGEWLISSDGYYPYCSECKNEPKGGDMTDFCPSCGVKMVKEDK